MATDLDGMTIDGDVNGYDSLVLPDPITGKDVLRKRYRVLCTGDCGKQLGWMDYDAVCVGYSAEAFGLFCNAPCVEVL